MRGPSRFSFMVCFPNLVLLLEVVREANNRTFAEDVQGTLASAVRGLDLPAMGEMGFTKSGLRGNRKN
jgi:hypothetical protein